jgi:hypothetical protein
MSDLRKRLWAAGDGKAGSASDPPLEWEAAHALAELEAVLQAVRRLLLEYTEGDPPSHPSVRDPLLRAIYGIDAVLKEDG